MQNPVLAGLRPEAGRAAHVADEQPQAAGLVWNKPKASTFARFGGRMVLDEAGHVQWAGLTEDSGGKEASACFGEYGARVTASHAYQVGAVVCVHARDMKEPWCLAASDAEAAAGTLIKQYARRWTIEPSFRDTRDLRFGMGMAEIRIAEPERRDRLLLISAFAMVLLTMLGQRLLTDLSLRR